MLTRRKYQTLFLYRQVAEAFLQTRTRRALQWDWRWGRHASCSCHCPSLPWIVCLPPLDLENFYIKYTNPFSGFH